MIRSTLVALGLAAVLALPHPARAQVPQAASTAAAAVVGTFEIGGTSTTSFGQVFFAPSGLQTIDYFRIHLGDVWTNHVSDPFRTLNTIPFQMALNVFDMNDQYACPNRPSLGICPGSNSGHGAQLDHLPYVWVSDPAGNTWVEFRGFGFAASPSHYYGFNVFWTTSAYLNFPLVHNSSYQEGLVFFDAHAVHAVDADAVFEVGYTVVPEPSTWLMMATGLLGFGFVSWRRKAEGHAA